MGTPKVPNTTPKVSFQYKRTSESKYSRYGFIAQEIERVLPNLVQTNDQTGTLALLNNDLVAVLTPG